ncbi:energy-coupling factor transporter ATPase [Viridibacillus sp. YIM B01967]|uniref:Energy-coupling factor transporter ATPase n=1 Tax=Viridibacillus soli TaxID=2798301 RepID=A0ABS1H700_9BACL|nr:energy-coupling factor transporter ATPase [Viridibacillus soli]MBK3495189.1 energy-coupling factor transporter ATPase [Viridibacillus soli]
MLTFDNVSFAYGQQAVLKNISLQIMEGEFLTIIGPNGSGKSTLSKLMNGLIQPYLGQILVDRLDTQSPQNLKEIRQIVGLIFQNPEDQFISTTVFDEVIFGLENIAVEPDKMQSIAEDALKKVGMLSYKDVEPHKLSGGQKQRVAIAAILAMKPKYIVFDESTAMLDPNGQKSIMTLMQHLHDEGFTIIHITHLMEEALKATRVLVLNGGVIVAEGAPVDVFHNSRVIENNELDVPLPLKLKGRLSEAGIVVPKQLVTLEGIVDYIWTSN